MSRKAAGDVHGAEGVDEPAVLGGRIDPACALELINIAEPLDPGGIDQVFFGQFRLIGRCVGNSEGDVLVNRVGNQRRAVVWGSGRVKLDHRDSRTPFGAELRQAVDQNGDQFSSDRLWVAMASRRALACFHVHGSARSPDRSPGSSEARR